ncbi:nuclear transport factor 2 family protein [Brachybacterium sp. FME24]|uniref:Rv0361 family membrane protein n=1 Tax=Brachybacterium sp. FME24 TaxID=2742605 RepID=UPI001866AE54|nr:nuclear transport factor 2 family protein [Brachybacterium sp. FME24]
MSSQPSLGHGDQRPRSKAPWIIGGVCALIAIVVVIVLVVGAVWYFALRQTPQSTVEDYFSAWQAADCERFEDLSTENFRGEDYTCEGWQAHISQQGEEGIVYEDTVVSAEVDGDRATVRVEETATKGAEVTEGVFDFELVQEDGSWLIDDSVIIQEPEEL